MLAPWERGPWKAESGRRGVCDDVGADAIGAGVAGVESRRHRVCDSAGIVGVRAMGGRV